MKEKKKFAAEKLKVTKKCEKKNISEGSDIKLVVDIQFNNYEVMYPGKYNPSSVQWWTFN